MQAALACRRLAGHSVGWQRQWTQWREILCPCILFVGGLPSVETVLFDLFEITVPALANTKRLCREAGLSCGHGRMASSMKSNFSSSNSRCSHSSSSSKLFRVVDCVNCSTVRNAVLCSWVKLDCFVCFQGPWTSCLVKLTDNVFAVRSNFIVGSDIVQCVHRCLPCCRKQFLPLVVLLFTKCSEDYASLFQSFDSVLPSVLTIIVPFTLRHYAKSMDFFVENKILRNTFK